jgi:hypothetical protein
LRKVFGVILMAIAIKLFSGNIKVFNRNYGDTYDNVSVDLSGGGRNVAPLATQADSAITLSTSEVADYVAAAHGGDGTTAEVAVVFGSYTADIDDNSTNENYACRVDEDSQAQSVVYQALQWMTSKDRTSQTLNSVPAPLYEAANAGYTPMCKSSVKIPRRIQFLILKTPFSSKDTQCGAAHCPAFCVCMAWVCPRENKAETEPDHRQCIPVSQPSVVHPRHGCDPLEA